MYFPRRANAISNAPNQLNVTGAYTVMQSDGNSFCGDVVLYSASMVFKDEDSILDQTTNTLKPNMIKIIYFLK